ncbi:DNA element excision controlling factor XisI [candidate division KSB1 bacterium RBG_16_48_16]|nr:MAG: DNA element excision controlling factor XisI [candidate division KSB1 bacterium RBG_16_48_16]
MDKTTQYRQLIKDILTQYASLVSKHLELEVEPHLIFDEERDEYLWVQTGWSSQHRVHGVTLHIRLHNGKIWIEQDWTEDGIATDLLKAGVPNQDIVLAFYEPEARSMTEFAIA